MASNPFLSIVIPAFNEEKRLRDTLDRVWTYTRQNSLDAEIIVVNDGSVDATPEIAKKFTHLHDHCFLVNNVENRGKGFSFRRGFLASKGNLILLTDADLSAPIEEFGVLMKVMREGNYDIAIGSRGIDPSKVEIKQNWVRRTMGKSFNSLVRMITKLPFKDTQCGFKLMARERVLPVINMMKVDRFSYDVELLFLASRSGLRIIEVPVVWRNSTETKVRMVIDSLSMIGDILKIKRNYSRGLYGKKNE
ncbi:MAG: dolichyl-phosphate beta-glucosyltransferase [Acidobacteriota bacterium]